jgi:hypothetical protein
MTRQQILDLPAHEHAGVLYIERTAVLQLQAKHRDELEVLVTAFDEGVFVRDTSKDNEPGWMLKLVRPLMALAHVKNAAQ